MVRREQRIPFPEFAERLQSIFDALASNGEAVIVEHRSRLYRVEPQPTDARPVVAPRDPEQVRTILQRTAGAFRGVDTEQLKRELREQRGQASRGRPNDY